MSIFKWPRKTRFPVIQYHFCIFSIQAGKYHEALELLKTALKIEEKELGARRHRMVELFALMAEIYDEVSWNYKAAWERSDSVVECLTRDREAAGSSHTSVTALWSLSKTHLS